MQPFTTLTAIAAPIDEANVDTNQLCPTRFNKVPRGPQYRDVLFHDLRFYSDGTEKEHILNSDPFRRAEIIVADRNPVRKKCLLEGLDDVARTDQYCDELAVFEAAYRGERQWLYEIVDKPSKSQTKNPP